MVKLSNILVGLSMAVAVAGIAMAPTNTTFGIFVGMLVLGCGFYAMQNKF